MVVPVCSRTLNAVAAAIVKNTRFTKDVRTAPEGIKTCNTPELNAINVQTFIKFI